MRFKYEFYSYILYCFNMSLCSGASSDMERTSADVAQDYITTNIPPNYDSNSILGVCKYDFIKLFE